MNPEPADSAKTIFHRCKIYEAIFARLCSENRCRIKQRLPPHFTLIGQCEGFRKRLFESAQSISDVVEVSRNMRGLGVDLVFFSSVAADSL